MKNIYSNIFSFNKKILSKTISFLKKGNVVGLPTETVYGLAGNAYSKKAIVKIYSLKKRPNSKAMICMVADLEMLQNHIDYLPEKLHHYINDQRPTTIIYKDPKGIAQNAIAQENTVAIRVLNHHF